jgi:hypothetical protein
MEEKPLESAWLIVFSSPLCQCWLDRQTIWQTIWRNGSGTQLSEPN